MSWGSIAPAIANPTPQSPGGMWQQVRESGKGESSEGAVQEQLLLRRKSLEAVLTVTNAVGRMLECRQGPFSMQTAVVVGGGSLYKISSRTTHAQHGPGVASPTARLHVRCGKSYNCAGYDLHCLPLRYILNQQGPSEIPWCGLEWHSGGGASAPSNAAGHGAPIDYSHTRGRD